MQAELSTLYSRRRMIMLYAYGVYAVVPASLFATAFGAFGIWVALLYCYIDLIPILAVFTAWPLGRGLYIGSAMIYRGILRTFRPIPENEPALLIDENNQPKLFELIRRCCNRAKCPMPDQIALHATSECMVTAGPLRFLGGDIYSGTCLILSLPMFRYLTASELRAVIHHELAHVTGGDIHYIRKVQPALTMAGEAARGIQEELLLNREQYSLSVLPLIVPLFLLQGYARWFHRKSMEISLTQEFLADRRAAGYAGGGYLAAALSKVEGVGNDFHTYAARILTDNNPEADGDVDNLYLSFWTEWTNKLEEEREALSGAALNVETETHASVLDRIASLSSAPSEHESDDRPAALWIHELESLECMTTRLFYEYVRQV